MASINKIIASAFFSLLALIVHGLPTNIDSLRFEVLLSNKMINDIHLDANFINSISITSNRLILLSSSDQFYMLGWGGIVPRGKKFANSIGCYAFTPDNYLMIISNNDICSLDSIGNLSKLIKLPNIGMGISAGKYVMYVYDRNKDQQKNALYIIAKGGKYAKLFEVTTPINSVVEMNDSILFASENGLFSFNLKSKEIKALAALPKDKEIKSIAVDTSSNRIYFSTDSIVYAIKDSSVGIIIDKFGGVLRFFNDGLIVFNPEKKLLIRIVGIENDVASKEQPMKPAKNDKQTTETLTNSSILNMVKTKISDDKIINSINSSKVDFNLSVDAIISLTNQDVSSAVINAMGNAMEKRSKGSNHQ